MRILPKNRVARVTAIVLVVAVALVVSREIWLLANGALTVVEDKNLVVTEPMMAGFVKPTPAYPGGFDLEDVPEFDICGVVRSPSGDRFMLGMRGLGVFIVVIEVKRTLIGTYAKAWYEQSSCAAPDVLEQAKRGSVRLSPVTPGSFPVHVKAEFETKLGVVRCQFVTRHQVSFQETLEERKRRIEEGLSCEETPLARTLDGFDLLSRQAGWKPLYNYARGAAHVLVRAAGGGLLDLAKELISNGMDVNVVNEWETPLIAACRSGQTNMVRFLIESGADVNKAVPKEPPRQVPTHFTAVLRPVLPPAMCMTGVFRNLKTTPLTAAMERCYQGIADMLRKAGARE